MNRREYITGGLQLLAAVIVAPTVDAQPKRVTFTAQIVEASNPPTPASNVDPALMSELGKSPIRFTQYKSLGTVTGSATVGQTWSTPLATTGLTLEATPKNADGGTVTTEVRILRTGSAVVTSTVRLAPGSPVVVGVPPFRPAASSSRSRVAELSGDRTDAVISAMVPGEVSSYRLRAPKSRVVRPPGRRGSLWPL